MAEIGFAQRSCYAAMDHPQCENISIYMALEKGRGVGWGSYPLLFVLDPAAKLQVHASVLPDLFVAIITIIARALLAVVVKRHLLHTPPASDTV